MDTGQLHSLLTNWYKGQATAAEKAELLSLLEDGAHASALQAAFERIWLETPLAERAEAADGRQIADFILERFPAEEVPVAARRIPLRAAILFRYAAILLLIAGTAIYVYVTTSRSSFRKNSEVSHKHEGLQPKDIPPGGNHAILTLSDGSTILLDNAANGSLATEGGTEISKQSAGMLVYQGAQDPKGKTNGTDGIVTEGEKMAYNTISTPKGGQYQITLPDGTRAWLNAASSITFPIRFAGERKVSIAGEVYLEVATDKTKPFYVTAGTTGIEVLGTSFNINSYEDEKDTRTTLINGAVRVTGAGSAVILKPGQQAVVGEELTLKKVVNTQQVIAWKSGAFVLNQQSLPEIMRQLARWYDVEVRYEGNIAPRKLEGEMGRDLSLRQCLKLLNIHYRLEEKKLTILP